MKGKDMRKRKFRQSIMLFGAALSVAGILFTTEAKAKVTKLEQTDCYYTTATVSFTEDSSDKYHGYKIYSDKACKNLVGSNYTSSSSLYISNLKNGSHFWITVGHGTSSDTAYNDPYGPFEIVTKPDTEIKISFVGADDKTATLQWTAVEGANYYEVASAEGGAWKPTTNSLTAPVVGPTRVGVRAVRVSESGYQAIGYPAYLSDVSALSSKIDLGSFTITDTYPTLKKVYFGVVGGQMFAKGNGWEAEGQEVKGKKKFTILNGTMNSKYGSYATVKNNTMYKFRVRAYVTLSDGNKKCGDWSDYKYFILTKDTKYTYGERGKITVKWGKLKGVGRVVVSVSTARDGKFTKVGTVKGSKKNFVIKKYKKKALKRLQNYYVRIEYQTKVKGKWKSSIIVDGNRYATYCR